MIALAACRRNIGECGADAVQYKTLAKGRKVLTIAAAVESSAVMVMTANACHEVSQLF